MKPVAIKWVGTIAAAIIGSGAAFLPEQYRAFALATSTLVLGWLHLPTPGYEKIK